MKTTWQRKVLDQNAQMLKCSNCNAALIKYMKINITESIEKDEKDEKDGVPE
jgi:hypothetical protein